MRFSAAVSILGLATACLLPACGARSPGTGQPTADAMAAARWPGGQPAPAACVLGAGAVYSADPDAPPSIGVAVTEAVDAANVPVPANAAERIVFQQLYETLLRLDCEGRAVPGLASDWRVENGGRAWSFTIRAGARFADGSAVGALDVARAWADAHRGTTPVFTNIAVIDDRTIRVQAGDALSAAAFAEPALAVVRRVEGAWPLGTTGYFVAHGAPRRLAPARPAASASLRIEAAGHSLAGPRTIEVRSFAEPRDAAGSADLIVTRDPRAIAYAAQLGLYEASPLPWDVTHALILTPTAAGQAPPIQARAGSTGSPAVGGGAASANPASGDGILAALTGQPADSLRWQLARDVVAGEARPAGEESACMDGGDPPKSPATLRNPREYVYPAGDPASRGIAERLTALATNHEKPVAGRASPVSRAGSAAEIDRALGAATESGSRDAAYVLPIGGGVSRWCRRFEDRFLVVPLVETRPTLIRQRGLGGIIIDAAGAAWLGSLRR